MKTTDKWMFLSAITLFSWALGNSAGWLHGSSSFVLMLFVIWLVFEVADSGAKQQVRKDWLDAIKRKQQYQAAVKGHHSATRAPAADRLSAPPRR